MNHCIKLWSETAPGFDSSFGQTEPSLSLYPVDHPRGAVLVLPGGGYDHKAAHEGRPVAERFNSADYFAAVLDYRVAPYRAPIPQWDAMRAIQLMRHLAPEYGYAPDRIAILGFSAGGHLAASVTYLDIALPDAGNDDPISKRSSRPNAAILCYPVITLGEYTHAGSRSNLLGEDASTDLIRRWSIEEHITQDAPPAFIWHTADDGAVPVQNSLMLASAMTVNHVPYSLHIWPHGRHGLGLAPENQDIAHWPELAAEWLDALWN